MRSSWIREARIAEVRSAARSWRAADAIDDATLQAIEASYPDPRPRLSAAWKTLIFILVSVAVHAVFFGVLQVADRESTTFAIVYGLLLSLAAELLRSSRFAGNGSDASASFWAIVYLVVGLGLKWSEVRSRDYDGAMTLALLAAAMLFTAACLHWGFEIYGGLAAVSLFLLLGRFREGRLAWALLGLALLVAAYRRLDRASPPPLRRAAALVFAVSAAALYVAVNRYSLDFRWIESLRSDSSPATASGPPILVVASLATALLPLAFLAWGIRARRTLLIDLGLVFAAASLVTLRFYVHLAPLWLILTAAGAALVVGVLGINRSVRRAAGGERRGFTAAPLFPSRRTGALEAAAVVAGFTHSPAAPRHDDLSTGGGRFGGGGASGEF